MNRIGIETEEGEFLNYLLNAVPVVDKLSGRLTVTDGKIIVVRNTDQWKSYICEPLSEEQVKQLAEAQVARIKGEAKSD